MTDHQRQIFSLVQKRLAERGLVVADEFVSALTEVVMDHIAWHNATTGTKHRVASDRQLVELIDELLVHP